MCDITIIFDWPSAPTVTALSFLQVRCMLNIWGVMLFIRMSWIVGQAGIGKHTGPLSLEGHFRLLYSLCNRSKR